MSSFRLPRNIAVATTLAFASATMALPAFAEQPATVSFQAGNPWTQEVGSVSRTDSSHDYTIAVEAGKTFQVNLVTRNPNVFFTVKNTGERKALVDTYKTGATTWSTQTTAAGSYTIHVYVQPDAMPRGEVTKYALQLGQYSEQDMQPASTEITFQDNNPWAQTVGTLTAEAAAHDYTVAIDAGKTLQVNLVTQNANIHFKVEDQASHTALVDSATLGANTWSAPVPAAGTYVVRVYAAPSAVPPGRDAKYALQIGQYASGAQPAAASTAAGAGEAAAASSAGH